MKRLIVFDLDGTLALSKSPIDAEMSSLLHQLLAVAHVAIISGGDWPQFEKQVLSNLPQHSRLDQLSILPTCGTKFFRYDKTWQLLYAEIFTSADKQLIENALQQAIQQAGFTGDTREKTDKTWGETIQDRGSQITWSALGQQAPLDAKSKWDPDYKKRSVIKGFLDRLLPQLSVRMGGTTSIDITKAGIDKAYGIRKLHETLGVALNEMIVIGDAMFPGGNDYPAEQAGVLGIPVCNPQETRH
jgi:phosphomannomutase